MERLERLTKKLKRLKPSIETFTREVIEDNRPLLEDFNALQLDQGLKADGSDITPEYHPFTVAIKKAKGQPYDRVTLKDTGAFYESIRIKTTRNELTYEATDSKTEDLQEKYGDAILGLSDEDKTEFIDSYLREDLQTKIRKYLEA